MMMIPSDNLSSYSIEEQGKMLGQARACYKSFKSAIDILHETQGKKVKDAEIDNAIFINPKILVEAKSFEGKSFRLETIFRVYESWFKYLDLLCNLNRGRLHRKKIRTHVLNVLMVCKTIQEIMTHIQKETLSVDTKFIPEDPGPKAS